MTEPQNTGGGPEEHSNDGGSIFDALDAEAAEEQHLDDRHATGEHYTGGQDDYPGDDPL
jgi:hypothetical protein